MAFRLSDYVVRGEINNTRNYSTFGRFELVGDDTPVMLELTGNCDPGLQGKRLYFEAVPPPAPPPEGLPKIARHLIGVTASMTAAGWVRTFECSTEEFLQRCDLGDPPPMQWKRRLYLEFYCQHGDTLIELGGPILEYDAGEKGEEDWRPLPEVTPPPSAEDTRRMMEQAAQSGPEISLVHDTGEIETIDAREYLEQQREGEEPNDLQRQLDAQAAAAERAIKGEHDRQADESDRVMAEMELMDYLIDHVPGDPLSLALQTSRRLPRPEDVPEDKIEALLKSLLAELALCGVALHVCPHYSPRDTYGLLVDKLFTEWNFRPQLKGTGWVQNYMTSEYCAACEAEAERQYNETPPAPPEDDSVDPPF